MVGHAERPSGWRRAWDWEPWEARRASLPARVAPDVREARESARLLLMVVRARMAAGTVPFEHAEALGRAAEDDRLTPRLRLRAAEALARLRMRGLRRTVPGTAARATRRSGGAGG